MFATTCGLSSKRTPRAESVRCARSISSMRNTELVAHAEFVTVEGDRTVDVVHRYGYLADLG